MKKILIVLLVLVLVLGGGGFLLATQADASEPGDTLYSVDLAVEDLQRLLTLNEIKLVELETRILEERISELENISDTTDDLEEVLAEVSVQQDRVKDCLGNAEANPEKFQDGELERVQNEYQNQLQEHVQVMEQVSNKVQNSGENSALEIKESLQQNLDLCNTGKCGSDSNKENTTNNNSGSKGNGGN